jgi:hypothetical protein
VTASAHPEDDVPTRPDAVTDPTALVLARIHGELTPLERKRLMKLVEAWHACSLNGRVIVESVALEIARPSRD